MWLLIATGMLCTLVTVVFARLAYGLIIPSMRADLGLSYAQAANLGTVTATAYLLFLLYAGVFAGRFGAKQSILLGITLAGAGFAGMSMVSVYSLQIFAMALLGLGTAFAFTPLISLLGSWYPERRGTVIGFANSGVGIGILISGALVPWITASGPVDAWRSVWQIFAVSAVFTFILVLLLLRNPPRRGDAITVRKGLLTVYRSPHVMVIGMIYGIVGMTYIVQTLFMYSFALESAVPPLRAGQMMSLMGLISVFAGPLWGMAADRIGHANALISCMALSVVATVMPVLWNTTEAFFIHYILMGATVSGLFTSILAASTSTVAPQYAPMAVSFVTLFFAFGQLLGPALAGALIDWQDDFKLTFIISALLLIAGSLLSQISRRYSVPRRN
jgi:MFS family permease